MTLRSATGRRTDFLDEALWGPAPSDAEVSVAQLAQVEQRFAARRQLARRSVSTERAAALFGASAQMVTEYLRKGDLSG